MTFGGSNGTTPTWILGAPEMVLAPAGHAEVLEQAGELARAGLRTLLLAGADGLPGAGKSATLPDGLRPVALLTFRNSRVPTPARRWTSSARKGWS